MNSISSTDLLSFVIAFGSLGSVALCETRKFWLGIFRQETV
jgi:hypothetical protein